MLNNYNIDKAMKVKITELPDKKTFEKGIRRAPKRELTLSQADIETALKNALRYVPEKWHDLLIPEFLDELFSMGRIYGYRFRPAGRIFARGIDEYRGATAEGRAFMLMMDNNLDFEIALYPYELVTYGETGQVCQNWMQYVLIQKYLAVMKPTQTLVIASGHPLGLFDSHKESPRVIITNGLMVGMFDNQENFNRAAALGVANYGQMTAGGWMYIGPQGIVHGTYNTILNAARLKLGKGGTNNSANIANGLNSSITNSSNNRISPDSENRNSDNSANGAASVNGGNSADINNEIAADKGLEGVLFVSSGLGGMSGAQGKAAVIAGGVAIIAEVDSSRIETRHSQGWVTDVTRSPKEAFDLAIRYLKEKKPAAIAVLGNIVDVLEYADEQNIRIDLLSDQTSCHAAYEGGYCPRGIAFEERTRLLGEDKKAFRTLVDKTLAAHFAVIKRLVSKGTYFFDYGNSFMKAVFDSGVTEICKNGKNELDGFIFPSYVEDILGPVCFDYGYGPFRWVCLSGKQDDLDKTDAAAMSLIDPQRRFQDRDNYNWIRDAKKNGLVVGSKARILYQDAAGRLSIALKFNEMVRNGEVGAIMLGRDHHDTGGTDSPFRETSNIKDGSNIMADMATHVFAGNAARGMSLIALHNGGGTGIGRSINGGYGMLLDGSKRVDKILKSAIPWDVMCGVSRRGWAGNENSVETVAEYNGLNKNCHITLPYIADTDKVKAAVEKRFNQ